jgi:hypothetical protein
MKHLSSVAVAAVLVAAPLGAQPAGTPTASASDSTPEIEQASYCAALQTLLGVLLSSSSKPNPALQDKLKRSSVRWLNHANAAVDQSTPEGRVLVLDRYSAHSDALYKERMSGTMKPAAVREAMTNDLNRCEKAERDVFGSSYKDL